MVRQGRFLRWRIALFAALALQTVVPGADGPPDEADTEARLRAVEAELQRLAEARKQPAAPAAQRPAFQIGGLINVDYLWVGQDTANRLAVGDAQDGANFRRARLAGRGEVLDVIEYAVGFDFALPGHPTFLDNYIEVRELPLLGNVRVGHFFEPFSLERFTQVRNTVFMERSLAAAFAPARNLGLMAHDTIGENDRGTWAIGWFRANSDDFGHEFGDAGGQAVTGRVTWLPYYDEGSEGRALLHLGAAYTYRVDDERAVVLASRPEARPGAPRVFDIPLFVDTGVVPALHNQRLGAELAAIYGPLNVQAEYIATFVDQIGGTPLFFHGAYGLVSYFLTGEHRTYNKALGTMDRVYPFENFFRVKTDNGIETGRGAWELAARWSFIDLDDANVRGGTLNDVTVAVNWHLNPYTRVKWEYIQAHLRRDPVGRSQANIVGMRFEVDF